MLWFSGFPRDVVLVEVQAGVLEVLLTPSSIERTIYPHWSESLPPDPVKDRRPISLTQQRMDEVFACMVIDLMKNFF